MMRNVAANALTLIIVLYDRFRTVYKARRLYRGEEKAAQVADVAGPAEAPA